MTLADLYPNHHQCTHSQGKHCHCPSSIHELMMKKAKEKDNDLKDFIGVIV